MLLSLSAVISSTNSVLGTVICSLSTSVVTEFTAIANPSALGSCMSATPKNSFIPSSVANGCAGSTNATRILYSLWYPFPGTSVDGYTCTLYSFAFLSVMDSTVVSSHFVSPLTLCSKNTYTFMNASWFAVITKGLVLLLITKRKFPCQFPVVAHFDSKIGIKPSRIVCVPA